MQKSNGVGGVASKSVIHGGAWRKWWPITVAFCELPYVFNWFSIGTSVEVCIICSSSHKLSNGIKLAFTHSDEGDLDV